MIEVIYSGCLYFLYGVILILLVLFVNTFKKDFQKLLLLCFLMVFLSTLSRFLFYEVLPISLCCNSTLVRLYCQAFFQKIFEKILSEIILTKI